MLEAYARIFERLRPYVMAAPPLADRLAPRLDAQPLGLPVVDRLDPTKVASGPVLDLLHRLDTLTFGPFGMNMPRWALYDLGELPGCVVGLGVSPTDLPGRVRRALEVPDGHPGLVPMSMAIAIPTLAEGQWLAHTLCSLNEVSPGAAPPGLRAVSLALVAEVLGATRLLGSTLWTSPKLEVWARFAPLDLRAAWVPAHTESQTCVFGFDTTQDRLRAGLDPAGPARPDDVEWLDVQDLDALRRLQEGLEAGERWAIAGLPATRGAWRGVPLIRRHELEETLS